MRPLAAQRCFNHAAREAVAKCTNCGHFFCRECASEHEGRVVCASCLAKLARKNTARTSHLSSLLRPIQFLLALCAAWFFFYFLGRTLLSLPASFHEGTLWKKTLSTGK